MVVRGLNSTPGAQKYSLPSTITPIQKTFGLHRDKYIKAVIRGDKQADRGNPGPGQYISDVLERSVSRNSKCGSMGFTNKEIPKVGRQMKGSMFDTSTRDYPGPQHY